MNEFEDKIISKPVTLMPGPKIDYLIKFIDRYKPKKILEVGSFAGGTAFTLAKKFPYSDIISIDNHHFILQIQNTDHVLLKWVEELYKVKLTFDIINKIHPIYERHANNLKFKSCVIYDLDLKKENFDFLKLNYTEFYGDNGTQWSWYNVPQVVREQYWPGKNKLPNMGLDPNAPKTVFTKILSHKGVPYAVGEVYYCNWPQIVSKSGNKKMFLDTTWAHPFEQTWMSHMYQLTKKGELNPGLLLMTPTEHDRFEHYDRSLRKES